MTSACRAVAAAVWPTGCFVLEPRPHAGLRHRLDNRSRRQLRGVVSHAQPLPDEVGHDVLEPRQRFQPALEDRDFLAAIHAVDLEDRLGVDFANGARDLLICQCLPRASFSFA